MRDLPPVVILGGGGHARVVAEALALAGRPPRGYLCPEPAVQDGAFGAFLGDDGQIGRFVHEGCVFALGLGFVDAAGAARRRHLIEALPKDRLLTVCHPASIIADSALLAPGVFVAAGAIICTDARIGAAAIINTGAIVEHDCRIGTNAHVATGSRMGGGVTVGENSLVGTGAAIRQGIVIGRDAVLGAGAVVVGDVPDGAMMLGNPARRRQDRA